MSAEDTMIMVDPKVFFDCLVETCQVKVRTINVLFMDDRPLILSMYLSLINTGCINAQTIYKDPEMSATFLAEIKKVISKELGDDAVSDLTYATGTIWMHARKLAFLDPTRKLDRAIKSKIGSYMDSYIKFNDEETPYGTPELASQVTA